MVKEETLLLTGHMRNSPYISILDAIHNAITLRGECTNLKG